MFPVRNAWLLGIAAFLANSALAEQEEVRPNVLLIVVDDLNDWIGCLGGNPQARTPNIDALADSGVLFTNAHCSAPGCNASRTSFLFGVSPSTSGIYLNGDRWRESKALQNLPSLPEWLRQHDYRTLRGGKLFHAYCFTKKAHTGRSQPEAWDVGFPSKRQQMPFGVKPEERPVVTNKELFYKGGFDWAPLSDEALRDPGMADTQVVDWAIGELGQLPQEAPFFMAVGIYRPHVPWYVPEAYFDRFPLDSIQLPEVREDDLEDVPEVARKRLNNDWHEWIVDKGQWKSAVQAYLASMAYADDEVGRLLAALKKSDHAGDTIVVLTSDHGYHLGEKQHWEKFVLWERATRVPLMVSGPGVDAGRKLEVPVSLLDLYPTISELAGLDEPDHLEGESLARWIRGEEQPPAERYVRTTQRKDSHALRNSRYRYIRYAYGSEELYDHQSDPHEWDNLVGQESSAEILESMRQRLAE